MVPKIAIFDTIQSILKCYVDCIVSNNIVIIFVNFAFMI